jgi:hypothetical protein
MSNLEFELWWAGGTTTLLTTQPQVGSRSFFDNLLVQLVSFVKNSREVKVSMVQPRCVDVVRLGRPLHRWELVGAMVWLMLAHVRP